MLSEQEQAEIRAEFSRYPQKLAMVPEALRIVQESRGWISDESIADIASLLEISRERVDTIASSYNMVFRRPVGRHVLLLCDNVSCWIMGSDALTKGVCERLGTQLGGTTKDGRFTVLPSACLGACHKAPVMLVDEELHSRVSCEDIEKELARYQ